MSVPAALGPLAIGLGTSSLAETPGGLFRVLGYPVTADDLWVVAVASLAGVALGVLGCFLVLRRVSLLGDAISHAILPGLAIAFMISGSRAVGPMLIGALVAGVFTAWAASALHRRARVPEDAALGVVFCSMFALGVLLITWVARGIDLDPGCVLYGLIEFVPFDTRVVLGLEVPRAALVLGVAVAVVLASVVAFFKELTIACFDPALATTMGISSALVHAGLLALTAGTAVASFEIVGSILVIAMLVAPGATAHLWTDRLPRMLWIAGFLGVLSAILGYALAVYWNTSVAGMMASVGLGLFILSALGAPRHGIIRKAMSRAALARRIAREDVLAILYRHEELLEADGPGVDRLAPADVVAAAGGGLRARLAWLDARRRGLVRVEGGHPRLTDAGRRRAQDLVRSHRLWETFLARRLGLPLDHVHDPAHRVEHYLGRGLTSAIEEELRDATDPHGRSIPPPA